MKPEPGLIRDTLRNLPENTDLHLVLLGMLGVATGASGDWREGVRLLDGCATNPACPVKFWSQATCLAALTGDQDLRRSLCALGVAHYAARADHDASRILVEPLLLFPPDASVLPVTGELVGRSLGGASYSRTRALLQLALLDYRLGQLADAAKAVNECLEALRQAHDITASLHEAKACFLLSMIETKRDRPEEARTAYQRGLRLHSTTWRPAGEPVIARDWVASCAAEFLRREAASLLEPGTTVP